jgi:predicted ATPase/DNA-binding CsgD family transcriptional regulator
MVGDEDDANDVLVESLTWREQDILHLLAERRTNREIAQSLSLELTTVKWYNKQIFSKLGVDSRYQAVAKAQEYGLLDEPRGAPASERSPSKNNLPAPVTSFVGRESQFAEVRQLLNSARLLTLTGPGGVGKTRLALQVAPAALDDFVDGVYLIEFAPIRDQTLVASTIALAMSVTEVASEPLADTLKGFLQNKQIMLLLDNFEHLLEAAPLLSDMLEAAPGLKVLATSRENLSLYGEQVYPLPPLETVDAVELFYHRARAVKPDFDPNDRNLSTVEQICSQLDGLPLAIELAAARVNLLPPQTLLQRLDERLDVLKGTVRDVPARHQTLRATLDWSYELLDPDEKKLFNRLGVFAGGCSLDAAETVCADELSIDLFDGLESLLNKSLLWQEQGVGGEPRFAMLETVREYAMERLAESGEASSARTKHAEYYVALAERAEPELWGLRAVLWLDNLEQELYNIRAALRWSLEGGDAVLGLRMSGALTWFWFSRHLSTGRRWAERVLEHRADMPHTARAMALNSAGLMALFQGDYGLGTRMFKEALELSRGLSDRHTMAWSMTNLGLVNSQGGEESCGQELLEEAVALFRELGDARGITFALNSLGELMRIRGEYAQARVLYEESVAVRQQNDLRVDPAQFVNLGAVMRHLGDDRGAWKLYEDALQGGRELGQKQAVAYGLMGLAGLLGERGQPERAVRLLGAAEAMLENIGFHIEPVDRPDHERDVATMRAQLDGAKFEAAWAGGQAMMLEEAVAYALDEPSLDE